MDAACSSPDFMVVEGTLVVHLTGAAPGPEWVSIECASREAYGCGELGDKLFQGLTLYVRRLGCADLNSCICMSIALTDEAVRSIQAELGVPDHAQGIANGCVPDVQGSVRIADRGVLVLLVVFHCWDHGKRVYYLVYAAADASLYMIPTIPSNLEGRYTVTPVPARPAAGSPGHELALAARRIFPQPGGAERGRLCLCTPATRAASPAPGDDGTRPWEVKMHAFPRPPRAFSADVMFSSGDKVFWADLSQGVAYSDLRQDGPVVDAVFVTLPEGYQIDYQSLPENEQAHPGKMSRTMGCVQGSIKFVCVDRGGVTSRRPVNEMVVKVWTLDLDRRRWKEDEGFSCSWEELRIKACDMDARLRDVQPLEPQFPFLMPDGALYLVLPKTRHRMRGPRVKRPDYICSFDMFSKNCLCFGQVLNYHVTKPVILPFNFFKNCCPAPKRKPPTRKRKLPSINV